MTPSSQEPGGAGNQSPPPGTEASLADVAWLIQHADTLLAVEGGGTALQKRARWQRAHGRSRGNLLGELEDLRRRARKKFSRADSMFFTRLGLEKATDERLAAYKAERFRTLHRVVDLCCGIGGDALGLAQVVPEVTAVDRDAELVAYTRANGEAHGLALRAEVDDVCQRAFPNVEGWHADPDRRAGGPRTTGVLACEPSVEMLRSNRLPRCGAIKLAPAADARSVVEPQDEREWIGHHRECQQQVLWLGDLVRAPGMRVATVLTDAGPASFSAASPAPNRPLKPLGDYLYEPSSPVLAAGLASAFARAHDLFALTPRAAYYTGEARVTTPLVARFRVITEVPCRPKVIGRTLKTQGLHVQEIKKRGADLDIDRLRKALRAEGDTPATVIIYPRADRALRAAIALRDDNLS